MSFYKVHLQTTVMIINLGENSKVSGKKTMKFFEIFSKK